METFIVWLTLDGLIAKVVLEWDLTGFYTQPTEYLMVDWYLSSLIE